jgi:hypothetical protein
MLLVLRRSGGFTGTTHRWQVDAGNDEQWRALVDRAGLKFHSPWGRLGRLLLVWPLGGAAHHDYAFDLWVDGQRASFRGVDVTGALQDLVERIQRDGAEINSPQAATGE